MSSFSEGHAIKRTQSTKTLEEIGLDYCKLITDKGIIRLSKDLIFLKRISLNHCVNIGNLSLYALVKLAKDLEWINMRGCTNVTGKNRGLKAFGQNCLKVNHTRLIGNNTVANALVISGLRRPKYIQIYY